MFQNVVVPLKEGLPEGPLLELAARVAAPDARVHLVTLVKFANDEPDLARLRSVEERLRGYTSSLRQDLKVSVEVGVATAVAALTVLNIARQRDADLLVVGLGKRTRVGKALMGSDAQRILIGSPCPVLVRPLLAE